jgi:hypothetical protein
MPIHSPLKGGTKFNYLLPPYTSWQPAVFCVTAAVSDVARDLKFGSQDVTADEC